MLYSSLIRPKRQVCLFSMYELVHYFLYCGLVIVYLGSLFSSGFSSYLELNNSKHPRLSISGSKDWIYIYICILTTDCTLNDIQFIHFNQSCALKRINGSLEALLFRILRFLLLLCIFDRCYLNLIFVSQELLISFILLLFKLFFF